MTWTITEDDLKKMHNLFRNNPQIPALPTDQDEYLQKLSGIINHLVMYYPTPVDDISDEEFISAIGDLLFTGKEHQVSVPASLVHIQIVAMTYLTRNIDYAETISKEWSDEEVKEAMSRDPGLVTQGLWLTEVIASFAYSVIQFTVSADAD